MQLLVMFDAILIFMQRRKSSNLREREKEKSNRIATTKTAIIIDGWIAEACVFEMIECLRQDSRSIFNSIKTLIEMFHKIRFDRMMHACVLMLR